MKKQLAPPKNWQDFEDLCHKLWRAIWGDIDTQKNGRQGQSQNGVDIFGIPWYGKGYYGVQCKGKTINYGSQLTLDELEAESKLAEGFTPQIHNFTIATTSPRDANIQKRSREMTEQHERRFPISVWSWDDISDEIQCRPEIYAAVYGEGLDVTNMTEVHFSVYDRSDKLYAFLTRPRIANTMSLSFLMSIGRVLSELIENAFKHGYATEVKVLFLGASTIQIVDNGSEFNAIDTLSVKGNGGHLAVTGLLGAAGDQLKCRYTFLNNCNVTEMTFTEEFMRHEISTIEIEFPSSSSFVISKRESLMQASKDLSTILESEQNVKLLIKDYGTISGCVGYLEHICQRASQRIESVSLPHNNSNIYIGILDHYNIPYTIR